MFVGVALLPALVRAIIGILLSPLPTARDALDEIPVREPTPLPPPKAPDVPVKTGPPPRKTPPTPKKPVQEPKPSPKGEPFPVPPPRKLPRPSGGSPGGGGNSGQRSANVTSEVSFTLATRTYGCMLYVPVSNNQLKIQICTGNSVYEEIEENNINKFKSFIAWLVKQTNVVLDELDNYPAIRDLLNSVGLGESIEEFLIDKFCDFAVTGLNLYTRNGVGKVVGNAVLIAGCEYLLKLAVSWAIRNDVVTKTIPVTTHSYTNIIIEECEPELSPPAYDQLPPQVEFNPITEFDDCSPVLLPDSAAFMNAGKYLVLYWVLEADPSYRTYVTTWQIPNPKKQIWDVVDSDGNIIPSRANPVWNTYFANLSRVQGYQYARYYAEGFRKPVFQGHFSDKAEAQRVFENLLSLCDVTSRSKAPITYGASEEKDYLKELSHVGERLIVKKAVVIDKLPWKDSATCLVTYTETKKF